MQNNLLYIRTRKRLHLHNNSGRLVLKLTIKRRLVGMVDSQSCSAGNRIGSYGTDDEKEGEPMSFGVQRPEGNIIWSSATSLTFSTGQMVALLGWSVTAPLASGFSPSPIAASPPTLWSSHLPETSKTVRSPLARYRTICYSFSLSSLKKSILFTLP